ncbi:hypothetical protein [Aurantiacibacter zhengii]|uniref:Uncharacterized protein n=1 Tax=Aurantiacibacter zhengii TaxID=2307003 RepID=A0A418NX23_9SPHN|nr:hypothetical protein [Aurantiacibacter zhengii]RIV89164.1 hypothetical protein D2V07_02690 [Aurantiacibacter zhengii]
MTRKALPGKVIQILLWYDIPEILLVEIGKNEFVLAVASGCSDDPENAYYGASFSQRQLIEYQDQKFDLRYALSRPKSRRYWRFEYSPDDPSVTVEPIISSNESLKATIPDAGVFARVHSKIEIVDNFVPDSEERFQLDGNWELGEFSQLYGKMEDVYYILNDIRRWKLLSQGSSQKTAISSAFEKPWRGGGSYRSFYADVANDNQEYSELRMGGISYHSPGYVTIKAKRVAFDQFLQSLEQYSESVKLSKKAYNKLYSTMSQNQLLGAHRQKVLTDAIRDRMVKRSEELSSFLDGVSYQSLVEMAQGDKVVASKVLLSIYRRIESLYKFFDEGRIAHPDIELGN